MSEDIGELAEIRSELRRMRWYVDGEDLRERVKDWIERSHERGDADTAREYVEQELNALLAANEMYHAPDLSRGEDGFPEACSDCRHYGSACPVLLDETEVRWRERQLDQAESSEEARRVYQQQAIDVSCQRIPELLEEWDNRYAGFIAEGQELLADVEDEIHGGDSETASTADAALPDGGTEQ